MCCESGIQWKIWRTGMVALKRKSTTQIGTQPQLRKHNHKWQNPTTLQKAQCRKHNDINFYRKSACCQDVELLTRWTLIFIWPLACMPCIKNSPKHGIFGTAHINMYKKCIKVFRNYGFSYTDTNLELWIDFHHGGSTWFQNSWYELVQSTVFSTITKSHCQWSLNILFCHSNRWRYK